MGSILLVEADPETRDRWSRALTAAGHAVVAQRLFAEALATIREGGIDLIVLDAPDLAGVLELARSIDALPDAPPLVLLSSSPQAPELSVRIGAIQFLPMPCDAAELVAIAHRTFSPSRNIHTVEVDDEPTSRHRLLG